VPWPWPLCGARSAHGSGSTPGDWIHNQPRRRSLVNSRCLPERRTIIRPPLAAPARFICNPEARRREEIGCDLDELERRLVLCYTGKPRRHRHNTTGKFSRGTFKAISESLAIWRASPTWRGGCLLSLNRKRLEGNRQAQSVRNGSFAGGICPTISHAGD